MWQDITEKERIEFNKLATHPLQSYEWGEFREATGVHVIRKGLYEKEKLLQAFQLTIHRIPYTPWTIGYLPKGTMPTHDLIEEIKNTGKENKCLFIQLEPNVVDYPQALHDMQKITLIPAAHPLFTKHTLTIDLTKSEENLLQAMHPKARYNIKVAQKHGVTVKEASNEKAFTRFWDLTQETTNRQHFFAHTKSYHIKQWDALPHTIKQNTLSSHLLTASYQEKILTTWILFVFKNKLYYPYGASSHEHRETMHSTLMMWEAIRFGKKNNLQTFDLWGAAAPNTPQSDPWFGFTQFKERFGPEKVTFVGSYDLVIHPLLYVGYTVADKLRWTLLRLRK